MVLILRVFGRIGSPPQATSGFGLRSERRATLRKDYVEARSATQKQS